MKDNDKNGTKYKLHLSWALKLAQYILFNLFERQTNTKYQYAPFITLSSIASFAYLIIPK